MQDHQSTLRILLLTPYTGGNLGDAAIQDALIHHLRKRLFKPQIRLVTLAPRNTTKLHGLPSFPIASSGCDDAEPQDSLSHASAPGGSGSQRGRLGWIKRGLRRVPWLHRALAAAWRLLRSGGSLLQRVSSEIRHLVQVYRLLKATDLLIMSGGGQIDDYWGGAFGHPYALFKWASLARLANRRVVFLSVGVCSLNSPMSRFFAFRALRLAVYRSYRDRGSKELLQGLAFTRTDPEYPDLAFSHPRAGQSATVSIDSNLKPCTVGVSPIAYLSPHVWPERDPMVYRRYLQSLSEFVVKLLEAGHVVVLFTSSQMDQFAANDLLAMLPQSPGAWGGRLRQVDQNCLGVQLDEIRKMDFIVASRLHGIILSHLLGKPTLAISYDRKVRAHMEAMEQVRFCLSIREATPPQLWDGFTRLRSESSAISTALLTKVEVCSQKLDQQYDLLVQLASQTPACKINSVVSTVKNASAVEPQHHQKSESPVMGVTTTEAKPNLDFMRACAVLFVLGFHLLLFFQVNVGGPLDFSAIGEWGVLIFFVHTSLVLTLSLERQTHRGPGRKLFWPFLIHRGFRILPLSVFIICVVQFCGLPVGHLHHGLFVPVLLNLPGLFSNIFLVQNITHSESVTAPLWSLPYEMQMYLLLPGLFLFARFACTVLPMVCLWAVSYIAMLHAAGLTRHGIPDLIVYIPCFLPGVIAFKLMSLSKIRLPSIIWPFVVAGITAIYLRFPSGRHGALCCLFLGLAIPYFAQISQPLVVKISQQIARYSYGIYLTHFICIWLAFQLLNGLPRPEQWLVFSLLVTLVPFALYHVIEAPMIRYGQRVVSRFV